MMVCVIYFDLFCIEGEFPCTSPQGLILGLLMGVFFAFQIVGRGGGGVLYSEGLTFRNFTRYKLI